MARRIEDLGRRLESVGVVADNANRHAHSHLRY